MKKIKKGDEVVVIAGKDKGKRGLVLSVLLKSNKYVVEGVNMYKKNIKPTQQDSKGRVELKSLPIHASNVMLYDPTSEKPSRCGFRILDDGRKVRYFKKSDELMEI